MDLKLIPYTIILIAFGAAFILHTTPPMPHPPQYDFGDVLVAQNDSMAYVASYTKTEGYLLLPVHSQEDITPPLNWSSGVWMPREETEDIYKKVKMN